MSVWYVAHVVYQCEYISGFQKPYVLKSYRGDGRRCIHAAVHNLKHLEFQTSLRHSMLPPSEKKQKPIEGLRVQITATSKHKEDKLCKPVLGITSCVRPSGQTSRPSGNLALLFIHF